MQSNPKDESPPYMFQICFSNGELLMFRTTHHPSWNMVKRELRRYMNRRIIQDNTQSKYFELSHPDCFEHIAEALR